MKADQRLCFRYIYTWKKVREHLLCFAGKLKLNLPTLQNVLSKLFDLSKSVVFVKITVIKQSLVILEKRNLMSDFRAPIIFFAINSFHEVWLYSIYVSIKLTVCLTNFDHYSFVS